MKKFSEKKLYELVSITLRNGVVLFIIIALFSFLFKNPLNKLLLDIALVILILTPVMRIVILMIGFYKLGDKRFSFYSFIILILLFLGIFIKK